MGLGFGVGDVEDLGRLSPLVVHIGRVQPHGDEEWHHLLKGIAGSPLRRPLSILRTSLGPDAVCDLGTRTPLSGDPLRCSDPPRALSQGTELRPMVV